jgi:hypothetical protein
MDAIDGGRRPGEVRDLRDRIDRQRDELDVKAVEHDPGAAGEEGVGALDFAWWRSGRPGWPSSTR